MLFGKEAVMTNRRVYTRAVLFALSMSGLLGMAVVGSVRAVMLVLGADLVLQWVLA